MRNCKWRARNASIPGQRAEVEDLSGGLARADEHGDVERGVHGPARRLRHRHRHQRARPRRLLPERGRRVVWQHTRMLHSHYIDMGRTTPQCDGEVDE